MRTHVTLFIKLGKYAIRLSIFHRAMEFYETIFIIRCIFSFFYSIASIAFLFDFSRLIIIRPFSIHYRFWIVIFVYTNVTSFWLQFSRNIIITESLTKIWICISAKNAIIRGKWFRLNSFPILVIEKSVLLRLCKYRTCTE